MGKQVDELNMMITQKKMDRIKNEVRDAARSQMELWIAQCSSDLDLRIGNGNHSVKSIEDLGEFFAMDGSKENCFRVWTVLIGQFETCKGDPFKEFEKLYMEQRKWCYSRTESDKKKKSGFIEKLVLEQKRQIIKLVNLRGSRSHGYTIGISRDEKMITEKNKFKKRKKGIFENHMRRKAKVSNLILISK